MNLEGVKNKEIIALIGPEGKINRIIERINSLDSEFRLQETLDFVDDLFKVYYPSYAVDLALYTTLLGFDGLEREKVIERVIAGLNKRDGWSHLRDICRLAARFEEPRRSQELLAGFRIYLDRMEELEPDLSAMDEPYELFVLIQDCVRQDDIATLLEKYLNWGMVDKCREIVKHLNRSLTIEEVKTMFWQAVGLNYFYFLKDIVQLMPRKDCNREVGKALRMMREKYPKSLDHHFEFAKLFTEPKRSAELMKVYKDCDAANHDSAVSYDCLYYRLKFLGEVSELKRDDELEKLLKSTIVTSLDNTGGCAWRQVPFSWGSVRKILSMIKQGGQERLRQISDDFSERGMFMEAAIAARLLPYPESDERIYVIIAKRAMKFDFSLFNILQLSGLLRKPNIGFVSVACAVSADHSGCKG